MSNDGNFQRRLSASNTHNPGPPSRDPRPELHEVRTKPAVYDSRFMAWRIRNPNHPLANDPRLENAGSSPRQQRLDTCNLLQLYHHLEYFLARYQMRYDHYENNSVVLMMPNLFIEPKPGWKLFNVTTGIEYTVRKALVSKDIEGRSTFDGRVLLEDAAGPPRRNKLVWIDPLGEGDGDCKLVKLVHQEELEAIMEPQAASSGGDVKNVRSKVFSPSFGYRLLRHEPGSVDNHPFGPNREIKPRMRMSIQDPDNPNLFQNIWGWWMDTLIEFRGYAVGGKVADRLSVWLRNFFMGYTSALKLLGVQEVLYWGTRQDSEESRTTYDLSTRLVQYYFRLEEIQVETEPKLAGYTLAFQALQDQDPVPWFTSEADSPEFPTDTSGSPLYGFPDIGDDY